VNCAGKIVVRDGEREAWMSADAPAKWVAVSVPVSE
jgi:hypothetical protein